MVENDFRSSGRWERERKQTCYQLVKTFVERFRFCPFFQNKKSKGNLLSPWKYVLLFHSFIIVLKIHLRATAGVNFHSFLLSVSACNAFSSERKENGSIKVFSPLKLLKYFLTFHTLMSSTCVSLLSSFSLSHFPLFQALSNGNKTFINLNTFSSIKAKWKRRNYDEECWRCKWIMHATISFAFSMAKSNGLQAVNYSTSLTTPNIIHFHGTFYRCLTSLHGGVVEKNSEKFSGIRCRLPPTFAARN